MDHDVEDDFGQVDHGGDSDDDFLEITQSSMDSSIALCYSSKRRWST